MSDSVQPRRRQPTRLPRPWDSPGKNTGVGCHFLLQCMKVKRESEVAQSCPTLREPMDGSPPGSSVHGIVQARVLEWVAIAFSTIVAKHGLSCLAACGIFLDQVLNPCPLHWQANSQPLDRISGNMSCLHLALGEGNGTPLQYSCLENPMGGGAW